jgi:predicted transcriptional regulator
MVACILSGTLVAMSLANTHKNQNYLAHTRVEGRCTMLVKNWMSKTVITIDVNDAMNDVMHLMKKHNIGMVPVMKNGKLTKRQWELPVQVLDWQL